MNEALVGAATDAPHAQHHNLGGTGVDRTIQWSQLGFILVGQDRIESGDDLQAVGIGQ